MWFWFLNHTLLSLLTLRKSTTSALIIGFSETFWFAPAFVGPYGCDLYWRKRLPFTHKHTQTHDWSHMAKVNSGLVDSNRFFNRGRILLKMVFGVLTAQNVPAVVKISGSHFVSPVYTYIYLKLFDFSAQWLVHTRRLNEMILWIYETSETSINVTLGRRRWWSSRRRIRIKTRRNERHQVVTVPLRAHTHTHTAQRSCNLF